MTDQTKTVKSKRLTCPICGSGFMNIFPAGECGNCTTLVCGHCISHDDPEFPGSICQACLVKMTPYGRLNEMPVDELLAILEDPSSTDSPLVARLFGDRKDIAYLPDLCRALASERLEVRREAAAALGKLDTDQAVPHILAALNDPAPAVRARAAESLADLGAAQAIAPLQQQIHDPSRQAAGHAVLALGRLMGDDACDLFQDLVRNHPSSYVRCEALGVLAGLDRETAISAAIDCLDHTDKIVVISACKVLARLNDLKAISKLKQLIERQPPASVRIMAESTLKVLFDSQESS